MENSAINPVFISRFLRILERDDLVAVIHQLHPEPIYLSSKSWCDTVSEISARTRLNNGIVRELMDRRLLIDNSDIDCKALESSRRQILQIFNRPTILYLMMAQGCNFKCTYCPIPALARRYGERLMSFEDAVAGIALWQKHIEECSQDNNPYFLIFYGGEPLLNREIFEQLLPYVDGEKSAGRLPEKLELMLCTNGFLVDERLSKLFAYYGVTVAIGVDGPEEHNDRFRITSNGDTTFAVIERAIKQLADNGVRVMASVTITPANVYRLAEYPDFLWKLGVAKFGFNLMKGEALIRELAGKSAEDYCRVAAHGVLSGLTSMAENEPCYEYQLEKKLIALRNGLPFSVDCTCYGNQLVIQADGQVSNCPFLRFDQGDVRELPSTFRIGQTETVKKWRYRLPLFNDSVMADDNNCVLDGGGCAWSSSELCGDAIARDANNAIFTKEIMYELIWNLLPEEQAKSLRQGQITYWSYRRIGPLCTAGTDNL
ncbi:hypothetical protein A3H65_02420 [Candidatus Giovannonibacteria bacterium RIFCSPLOWO2_02_FULL_45_14]|uniref:Radical SAM core domain-containing protein n=1 Tax=Candidatus Giovannonibacteria bacterium RIFCSPLOWO2_12_FULL_44_15 TaxID=1798364 RepID=A0A1F5Y1U1_9BACT|nr:MAG: hypothetical protein A3C75_00155 [Candidatus Giovannonibacteria bacterium RIFCSPHIGHO2_02_FULL_44_31]OGF75930.1 MAG: hypothetical protein A3E62_00475 [Candidatus Giovannonibacteria bacterium RIFCSPHIGHO2_12_FULL_44_29]OGF91269.1 MAG: hypothetical protein A3H65_02420 [Candidatus Giovannonibacteria bacterium RIFCSPLOWO2_02_FULL_45_14]OGF93831.1 MAG: hypothetical protein A3G54_03665 [Candidatus Giovannonibacteria bacterium RIFCSPLOWO2_12_FULL_44_15]